MSQFEIEETEDEKEKTITIREHLPKSHIPEDIIEENGKVKFGKLLHLQLLHLHHRREWKSKLLFFNY